MPRAHKEREIVETAAGFGLPHDKICQLNVSERTGKPIDAKTLRSAFRAELDGGVAVGRRQRVRYDIPPCCSCARGSAVWARSARPP